MLSKAYNLWSVADLSLNVTYHFLKWRDSQNCEIKTSFINVRIKGFKYSICPDSSKSLSNRFDHHSKSNITLHIYFSARSLSIITSNYVFLIISITMLRLSTQNSIFQSKFALRTRMGALIEPNQLYKYLFKQFQIVNMQFSLYSKRSNSMFRLYHLNEISFDEMTYNYLNFKWIRRRKKPASVVNIILNWIRSRIHKWTRFQKSFWIR